MGLYLSGIILAFFARIIIELLELFLDLAYCGELNVEKCYRVFYSGGKSYFPRLWHLSKYQDFSWLIRALICAIFSWLFVFISPFLIIHNFIVSLEFIFGNTGRKDETQPLRSSHAFLTLPNEAICATIIVQDIKSLRIPFTQDSIVERIFLLQKCKKYNDRYSVNFSNKINFSDPFLVVDFLINHYPKMPADYFEGIRSKISEDLREL